MVRHCRTWARRSGTALSYTGWYGTVVRGRSGTALSYGTARYNGTARYDGTAWYDGTARYDGTALSYMEWYGTVVRGRGGVVRHYRTWNCTAQSYVDTHGAVRQRARRDRTHVTQHAAPHMLGALAKGTSNPRTA
ncbi:hypothetical protein Vretifemale_15249 [Volvox reticuliferus]|uniref:Uncharacterized protein n=1 Tax=Volvox reticuliferus TaxID=1737510 RepID=A0A8J4FWI5_9CHLO|nr:hypothetical protein Vretifemale_15249 [Volvox reticuliferus]